MEGQRQIASGRATHLGQIGALGLAATASLCVAVLSVFGSVPTAPVDGIPAIQVGSSSPGHLTPLTGPDGRAGIWRADVDRESRGRGAGRADGQHGDGPRNVDRREARNGQSPQNEARLRLGEGSPRQPGPDTGLATDSPQGRAPGARNDGNGDRTGAGSRPGGDGGRTGNSPPRNVTAPAPAPTSAASDPQDVDTDAPSSNVETDTVDGTDPDVDNASTSHAPELDDPDEPGGP